MGLFSKSESLISNITVVSVVLVFFLKQAAIIIAILGQKSLHWQLSKVVPSGMYNCNWRQ